jgi:hypothetical protein
MPHVCKGDYVKYFDTHDAPAYTGAKQHRVHRLLARPVCTAA